jgi:hypothetical protein
MKGKNLVILVVLAVILSMAAFMMSRKEQAGPPAVQGEKVLPDLDVNRITRIAVTSTDSTAVVAEAEGRWLAENKYDYPVKFEKVRQVLLDLYELKVGQLVRAEGRQLEELEMQPPDGTTENAGVLVELYAGPDAPNETLLLGKERMASAEGRMGGHSYPAGRYVSPDMGQTVFLVSETLGNVSPQINRWLNTQIVNVRASAVEKAVLEGSDRKKLVLKLNEASEGLTIDDVPADKEVDDSQTRSIRSALSYFRFDDVADPSLSDDLTGLDSPALFTVITTNGVSYTVKIGSYSDETESERYVKLSARVLERSDRAETPAEDAVEEETAGPEKEEKEAEDDTATLHEEIEELNNRVAKWTYLVADHKVEPMLKTRNDILTEKEDQKDSDDASRPENGEPSFELPEP